MKINSIRKIGQFIRNRMPSVFYAKLVNILNVIRRKKHRISPIFGEEIFLANDGESKIYFCRRRRSNMVKRGVMCRVNELARRYCLDKIDIIPGGVFIDSGANIGELGLWARPRGFTYIAFEPELLEARCCDLNNFGGCTETRREALYKEVTTLSFYSKPESADSSIFDTGGSVFRTCISAVTLDSAVYISNVSGTVIFKVEAEGAEPEVLEGAVKTLASIDWVTVDCGYERGREKTHTFIETNIFLHDHDFRPQYADLRERTILYRNMKR